MTLGQLVAAFLAVAVLLTLGAAFDGLTVLDNLAVSIAGVCYPVVDALQSVLGA
jgi:hypothetical protein